MYYYLFIYLLKLKRLSGRLIVQYMVQLKVKYKLLKTEEFEDWLDEQPSRSRIQIADRLDKIKDEGYFGDHKEVRDNIWELRWKNGRRIYYSLIPIEQVLLLIGGNKNGQTKAINQAEKIYEEWVDD
jgi:putative addiction module killer protein